MGGVGGAGSHIKASTAGDVKNLGKVAGKIETLDEKVINAVKEAVKDAGETVTGIAKTPEGKAIATGVLFKAIMPFSLLGDAIILGGAACAAKNHMSDEKKEAIKDAGKKVLDAATSSDAKIIGGALVTPLAPIVGPVLMTAGVIEKAHEVHHAKSAGKAIGKAAASAVSSLGKAAEAGEAVGKAGAKAVSGAGHAVGKAVKAQLEAQAAEETQAKAKASGSGIGKAAAEAVKKATEQK